MQTNSFFYTQDSGVEAGTLPSASYIDLAPLPKQRLFFVDVNNEFAGDGRKEIITDVEAIKAQIKNILSTPLGSEPFEPEYGSLLPYRLFEPINAVSAWNIENDTVLAVQRWMRTRINLRRDQCQVRPLENDDAYYIALRYQIVRTKAVVEWTFSIYR